MAGITVHTSDYVRIFKDGSDYYLECLKKGISMQELNAVLAKYPYIAITDFMAIKNVVLNTRKEPVKFGEDKELYSVQLSDDNMKAYITINISEKDVEQMGIAEFSKQVDNALKTNGVVYGSKLQQYISAGSLILRRKILIAEGLPVLHGENSKQTLRKMNIGKTVTREDGSVDYFQVNIITPVGKGEWLGEWTDPTLGVKGMDVKGKEIKAEPGKIVPLPYDKATVSEVRENGKTTIVSMISGALEIENGRISVSTHMEIKGNVDFTTGNIHFDGSVTVKGTVMDSFSVIATKNIEILGKEGIGCANKIVSKLGSIIIQGGVNGRGKTSIIAEKDIIIKYVADAEIICNGSVRLSSYALNGKISAREVLVEGSTGQIIGGKIKALSKVVSPIIGSNSEIPTQIEVKGISKAVIQEELTNNLSKLEKLKLTVTKMEKEVSELSGKKISEEESKRFYNLKNELRNNKNEMKEIEDERRRLGMEISILGEGEVRVTRQVFPNVLIQIKGKVTKVRELIPGCKFYFENGEIIQVN